MPRVLDLGCGDGESWRTLGSNIATWNLVGLDRRPDRLAEAHRKYHSRGWSYICGTGENLPFPDCSLDGVISRGALPYMRIPQVLCEIHRVLVPEGWLAMSLHDPSFTCSELRLRFPRPRPTLGRTCVLLNGIFFHFTGQVMSVGKTSESCQTEAGMRIALRRAHFVDVSFRREGPKFFVEARREPAETLKIAA